MNTSKQINAMIVLMCVLLLGVGAYTIWDPFRAEDKAELTKEEIANRAAATFARNCRVCHGNEGEGRIGPALNPQARVAAGLNDFTDPAHSKENTALVQDTIMCGRIGKVMPPWAIAQGGSLNDEQIRQLVILITENPSGNSWEKVAADSAAENAIAPLADPADVLKGASITGANVPVCGQKVAATTTPTPTPGPVTSSPTVNATDNKFDVDQITISGGQSVTLTFNNKGNALHNWHAIGVTDATGKEPQVQLIPGGQSQSVTFTISQKGAYRFQCDAHPTEMIGVLFVQ